MVIRLSINENKILNTAKKKHNQKAGNIWNCINQKSSIIPQKKKKKLIHSSKYTRLKV